MRAHDPGDQLTNKTAIGSVVILLGLIFSVPALASGGWEYLGVVEGVKTWRQDVPGEDIKAIKGTMVADVHIAEILSVFIDPNQRKHWIGSYSANETLEKGPRTETYRIRIDLPFPIKDRDFVMKADCTAYDSKRVFECSMASVEHPKAPENDCCVRAMSHGNLYRFEALQTPAGKEQTRMTVVVKTDPKGSLPQWLVRMIQKKWPSNTLNGLVAHAEKTRKMHPYFKDWHRSAP